jgi:hypothetical protein
MFNFLPESLDPTLRIVIAVLIIVHLVAFTIWITLVMRGGNKKTDNFESYVRRVVREDKDKLF